MLKCLTDSHHILCVCVCLYAYYSWFSQALEATVLSLFSSVIVMLSVNSTFTNFVRWYHAPAHRLLCPGGDEAALLLYYY